MNYNKETIKIALRLHREHYEHKREASAHSGYMSDGGYSHQMELSGVFDLMWNGEELSEYKVPQFLSKFLPKAIIESEKLELSKDPEFSEFLKLHSKFKKYV